MVLLDPKLKIKARNFRKNGKSYDEIANKVGVVKSTVRYWCKDIILKIEDQERLYTKGIKALSNGPRNSHERRLKEIEKIVENAEREIIFPIHNDTYKLFGAALYWTEGNKMSDFTISNSDPLLIQFMVQWFCDMFNITPNNLQAHLNIYHQQNDLEIKKYWSDLTEIPINNFGKTFVKPFSKNYKKNTLYFGTIRIEVPKGTDNRYRVYSWTQVILKDIAPKVKTIEKKWNRLTKVARPVNMP